MDNHESIHKQNTILVWLYKIVPFVAVSSVIVFAICSICSGTTFDSRPMTFYMILFFALDVLLLYSAHTQPFEIRISKEGLSVRRWRKIEKYSWDKIEYIRYPSKITIWIAGERFFNHTIFYNDLLFGQSPNKLMTELKKYKKTGITIRTIKRSHSVKIKK